MYVYVCMHAVYMYAYVKQVMNAGLYVYINMYVYIDGRMTCMMYRIPLGIYEETN